MRRLVFVDDVGGSLAVLAVAMARLEGAAGFDEAVPRCLGSAAVSPVVAAVLAEIGLNLSPSVETLDPGRHEGDTIVSLGDVNVPGAALNVPARLAAEDEPALVKSATARIARERIGRAVALFCRSRGEAGQ
jgi:hypothetical protein